MKKTLFGVGLPFLFFFGIFFDGNPVSAAPAQNCTLENKQAVCRDEIVKERVDWACALVERKGNAAIREIKIMRYDCCGEPDYVWINDLQARMVMHPIKSTLDGIDLSDNRDTQGKKLFVEFVQSAKKQPGGAWVNYYWPKYGEIESSPKKSWVKKCRVMDTEEFWVVGSGTWK